MLFYRKEKIGVFLFALSIISTCSAGQQSPQVLGLKDALQLAAQHYPALKEKAYYTQAAEQQLKATQLEYMPALVLHGQMDYGTDNSAPGLYFPQGIVPSVSGGIANQNNWDAEFGSIGLGYLQWSPVSFGQYRASVNTSKAELGEARNDQANEQFQEQLNVCSAYLNLLVLMKLSASAGDNLARALQIQQVIVALARNSLRPGVDSSFADAEVSKARLTLLQTQDDQARQQSYLADLLGLPSQEFTLDTLFTKNIPVVNPDTAGAMVDNNPELLLDSSQVGISSALAKYIGTTYWPKVSVIATGLTRGSGFLNPSDEGKNFWGGVSPERFDYAAGIAFTFNILDYPRVRSNQKAEQLRTQALQQDYNLTDLTLQNQYRFGYQNLHSAIAQAKEAPIQYASASNAYTQKLALYHSGLTSIADVAQTLYDLDRAETDLALSTDRVWEAVLYIASARGEIQVLLNQVQTIQP